MKKIKLAIFCGLLVSANSFASGSGGTPNVPCYVNGEYVGTIEITKCTSNGGSNYKNQK